MSHVQASRGSTTSTTLASAGQPIAAFLLEPAVEYTIDVLDTWAMTITRLDGTHSGRVEIQLPGRQYIAVRFEAVR